MALLKHARFVQARGAPDYPDIGGEETALSDAQRASVQKVQLELSIAPDGILDLCRLGWLDPDTARDAGAVGDAVSELTNAALSCACDPACEVKNLPNASSPTQTDRKSVV